MQNHPAHPLNELGHSPDALAQRRAELLALLSQAVPEVLNDHQQINVDKLKELLGQEHIAGDEHYELSWAGKAAARREIQKTSSHTLLPAASNPPNAPHMLIEGENLEVLRVLQKSYYGKVKMIYIDPPYNTGNDSFVYPDDYSETLDEYQKRTGEKNEAGYLNKQSLWKKNSKESGQYHSAWLSMMYPRLYLARNLLRDDGVIFISIDDNEAANLKLLCDEIFGFENFVANFIWKKRTGSNDAANMVSLDQDYVICYCKNSINFVMSGEEKNFSAYKNPDNDPRGDWMKDNLTCNKTASERPNLFYPIIDPDTSIKYQCNPNRVWAYEPLKMRQLIKDGKVIFPKSESGTPGYKRHLSELRSDKNPFSSIIDAPLNTIATRELREVMGGHFFDFPKSVGLIEKLIRQGASDKTSIVFDFFAGSGTTAHAVMELNTKDGGNRQCISVQMPELLNKDSEAYKSGYRTIADITRARIDKVIAKLKAAHPDKTADLACAHFTLAPSNFKVWRSDVNDAATLRDQLAMFQSAEKPHQAPKAADAHTAMLAELLLKNGLGALGVHAISQPQAIAGVTVHSVLLEDNRTLWLCFEPYTEALKDEIVKAQPAQVIVLNSCFVGDKADELLANLQLELAGLEIGLTVI